MKRAHAAYSATPASHAHERQDCAVRAIRVACDVPYRHAHTLCAVAGRRDKHRISRRSLEMVMSNLPVQRVLGVYKITLTAFLKVFTEGRYVVHRRDHLFVVIDGTVHDWKYTGTGARSRVTDAWRVL